MSGGEIITLQFGNFSNYVGAHYWNIQDELAAFDKKDQTPEINRRLTLRNTDGSSQSKLRNTPRVVMYDLSGALGSMHSGGSAGVVKDSEAEAASALWTGSVSVHESDRVRKNEFLQSLDDEDRERDEEGRDDDDNRDADDDRWGGGGSSSGGAGKKQGSAGSAGAAGRSSGLGKPSGLGLGSSDYDDGYDDGFGDSRMKQKQSGGGRSASAGDFKKSASAAVAPKTETKAKPGAGSAGAAAAAAGDSKSKPGAASSTESKEQAKDFKLDGQVKYWTDYLKVQLHHKSLFQLPGIHHDLNAFENFGQGMSLFKNSRLAEDMTDRLRFFAEECDTLQGIQVLVDSDSGFAGLASEYLAEVRDDYRCPIFTFANEHYQPPIEDAEKRLKFTQRRITNTAFSQHLVGQHSSVYVPSTVQHWQPDTMFPSLNLKVADPFHTSAVLASLIHTATVPYQLSSGKHTMGSMRHVLVPFAKLNTLTLSGAFPAFGDFQIFQDAAEASHDYKAEAKDKIVPLYDAKYLVRTLPFETLKKDALISEWTVLRGSRVFDSDARFRALQSASSSASSSSGGAGAAGDAKAAGSAGSSSAAGGSKAMSSAAGARAADAAMRGKDTALTRYETMVRNLAASSTPRCRDTTLIQDPLPVPLPFPHFFKLDGEVVDCPVVTDLFASRSLSGYFQRLHSDFSDVARSTAARFQFEKDGLSKDDFAETANVLADLGHEYDEV